MTSQKSSHRLDLTRVQLLCLFHDGGQLLIDGPSQRASRWP